MKDGGVTENELQFKEKVTLCLLMKEVWKEAPVPGAGGIFWQEFFLEKEERGVIFCWWGKREEGLRRFKIIFLSKFLHDVVNAQGLC